MLTNGIIEKFLTINKNKYVIILLPTSRASSSLKNIFLKMGYQNLKIHSISDLSDLVTLKKQYTILSRIGLVAKISQIIIKMNLSKFKDLSSIAPLAEYLASVINNVDLYKIDFDLIVNTLDENLSIHKQELFLILKEFIEIWRKCSYISKTGYNNLLIEELSKNLQGKTLVMAGISYNTPSIIELMKKSCLVLHGLDQSFSANDWDNIGVTHGQYNFKQILNQLNVNPQTIDNFNLDYNKKSHFISQALRPSELCANWHSLTQEKISNIKYLKCNDLHHEAKLIVSSLKNESYKSAMVIINDDALMVKVILNLKQANLDANIVRDYPLKQSNTGIWLDLCLNLAQEKFSLVSSLALLKHNLANIDQAVVAEIESLMRDKTFYGKSIFDVVLENDSFNLIYRIFKEFEEVFSCRLLSFEEIFKAHISFAEKLSKSPLWEGTDTEELKIYLDQILDNATSFGNVAPYNYPQVYNHFVQSSYYRPEVSSHAITLLKPIDARLHRADLVILAGLNEGTWPSKTTIDPCFDSNSFSKMGFPRPEQMIGEEAYDFECFIQNKQVLLTRSEKVLGVLTTPSRWLLRILTLIKIECLSFNESIAEIKNYESNIICPIPPLKYRPTKLSVTQIDKLVFNPYHIYVDLILKLKKSSPLVKKISASDFGVFVHRALEIYSYKNKEPNLNIMLDSGKQALIELNLNSPKLKLVYWQRFIRIAKWFIANKDLSNKAHLEEYGKILICKDFTLIARADRVEVSLNNSLHIIDYKTGQLTTNKAIASGRSLQLLLEGVIGKNGGFYFQKENQDIESLTYLQLSGGEDPVKVLEIDISDKKIIEDAEEYLHFLIKQYQDPLTPYHYTKKKRIGYCEYAHLARIF